MQSSTHADSGMPPLVRAVGVEAAPGDELEREVEDDDEDDAMEEVEGAKG